MQSYGQYKIKFLIIRALVSIYSVLQTLCYCWYLVHPHLATSVASPSHLLPFSSHLTLCLPSSHHTPSPLVSSLSLSCRLVLHPFPWSPGPPSPLVSLFRHPLLSHPLSCPLTLAFVLCAAFSPRLMLHCLSPCPTISPSPVILPFIYSSTLGSPCLAISHGLASLELLSPQ